MNPDTQILENDFTATATGLSRAFRVDFDYLSTSFHRFVGQHIKERAPRRIIDVFVKCFAIVFNHLFRGKVFDKYHTEKNNKLSAEFMQEVFALIRNLFMQSGKRLADFCRALFGVLLLDCLKPLFTLLKVFGVVDQFTPDIVYAATMQAGIHISPNQGDRWLNLGTPRLQVNAIAVGSLYAATNAGLYQLTGTGVLAGMVQDAGQDRAIDNALVETDLGTQCRSILGEYMMVMPTGIFDAQTTAENYQTATAAGLTVTASEVTRQDFDLLPGSSEEKTDVKKERRGRGLFHPGRRPTSRHPPAGGFCGPGRALFTGAHHRVPPMKTFFFLLTGLAAALLCAELRAATLFQQMGIASPPVPVGSGARAMGMGGAFIATADDATAASCIVGAGAFRSMEFTAPAHPESDTLSEDHYAELNYLSATCPAYCFKNMVFSVNYQRLFDFTHSFNYGADYLSAGLDLKEDRRFHQEGHIGAVGLAVTIELTPSISFGGALNIWTGGIDGGNGWRAGFHSRAAGSQADVPVTIHTTIDDRYERFRGVNFNLGILWKNYRAGRFAAVIKTPFTAGATHRFRMNQTTVYGPPLETGDTLPIAMDEAITVTLPFSYGAGWSRRFSDLATIGVDLSRTHWEDDTLTDGQGNRFNPIDGRLKSASRVAATTHLRLGAEYVLALPRHAVALSIRSGAFYDPEPGRGHSRDFYGIALGAGCVWKDINIDTAYQLRWGEDVASGNIVARSKADSIQHRILISLICYLPSGAQ